MPHALTYGTNLRLNSSISINLEFAMKIYIEIRLNYFNHVINGLIVKLFMINHIVSLFLLSSYK